MFLILNNTTNVEKTRGDACFVAFGISLDFWLCFQGTCTMLSHTVLFDWTVGHFGNAFDNRLDTFYVTVLVYLRKSRYIWQSNVLSDIPLFHFPENVA